ncbi:MAG TPA: MFS transporter [Luteibacter sp.]|uniref:MFS transporter n=1 Tax=Luteibacter sp. TaxID=1886636 RepID=UPI002C43713D|nr:MFS transporter [Luteibacter sp.]HVI55714.1 MFS transporter [Luteibacter sp.]
MTMRTSKGRRALEALNFFMADVQAGVGPFLGVFLQSKGWNPASIGSVMTIGGIAGMLSTGPAGALVDATRYKRSLVVTCSIFTVLASLLLWRSQAYAWVAASQMATAIGGAALGPLLAGITLGMVRESGFAEQFGRNQIANHAGNVVAAASSGYLGWRFGFGAIFVLAACSAVLAIVSVLLIPAGAIDHRAARGFTADDEQHPLPAYKVLLASRPLMVLGAALALFHLGNAAMLPLYGMAVVNAHEGDPAIFTAKTVVVAQLVMILASYVAMRSLRRHGYWSIILITFLALPVRGVVAALVIKSWGVWPVQALDGIGAGLQSVAVPALVARLLEGSGHVNVGQGAVMTLQAVGAALSPLLGGVLAQYFGYRVAFLLLGGIALGSLLLWLSVAKLMRGTTPRGHGAGDNEVP